MSQNDVLKATKQAVAQLLGQSYMTEHGYLEGIGVNNLIDIGKDIVDAGVTADNFSSELVKQISKIIVLENDFADETFNIWVDNAEFGGAVETVTAGYLNVYDDPMLAPRSGNGATYSEMEHDVYNVPMYVKVYDKISAKLIPLSIPSDASANSLLEAFSNPDDYTRIVGVWYSALNKTIRKIRNAYIRMLIMGGIAVSDRSTQTARHLVTEAISKGLLNSDATYQDFLNSEDCLSYLVETIQNVSDNLTMDTTAYNNGGMPYGVAKNNQTTIMISSIYRKITNKVKAKLFNDKYFDFDVTLTPTWQAVLEAEGNEFSLETTTTISITADNTNYLGIGTGAYKSSPVVAFMYGYGALMETDFWHKTTTSYTAVTDVKNIFDHHKFNLMINPVVPMVAFILD